MMKEKTDQSRRTILKGAAAGVAMASLNGIAPASVLGANETIRMGVIGTGGRGQWGLREAKQRGARIAAVCDVYEERLNQARALSETDDGKLADMYYEHEKLLERPDIDAVYIATPDHWHHDVLIDTVNAGKDAYTEKPFSHTIEEGQEMIKAVRSTDRVVQVGNHRRSGEHWKRAREVIQSGKLGKVVMVKVWDTRNWSAGDPFAANLEVRGRLDWDRFLGKAPKRAFDPYRYYAWRWYWDYAGGLMTDIGAHQLDVNQWLMDVTGPKTVAANGGNHYFPHWETPDVVHSILNYGDFTTLFTVEFINDRDSVGAMFCGSEGSLTVDDRNGFRVFPQGEKMDEPIDSWPRTYEGGDHVANFLECVKTRKEPNSPVEVGHQVINAAHLGNISYRTGRRVKWDAEQEEFLEVRRIRPTDAWMKSMM
ncbi:MAG: gfo/Idh/MocA family oxidoreductase [bacterium]|nr:gfo/Idh/MocA family oxidoreductase [bacterium]